MFKKAEKKIHKTYEDVTGKTDLEKAQAAHEHTRSELGATLKQLDNVSAAYEQSQLELSRERAALADAQFTIQSLQEENAELKKFITDAKVHLEEFEAVKAKQSAHEQQLMQQALADLEKQHLADGAKAIAADSAKLIYEATNGMMTDEGKIVKAVAPFTNGELQVLKQVYVSQYGKEVTKVIGNHTSGNLRQFLLGLFDSPVEYLCKLIKNALSGMSVDEVTLVEILCATTNEEAQAIQAEYQKLYEKNLLNQIEKSVQGDLKRFLVICLQGTRENKPVDAAQVKTDAEVLYNAGQGKMMGTDNQPFIQILGNRSAAHLAALQEAYKETNKNKDNLANAIRDEFGGNLERALLVALKYHIDSAQHYASVLSQAFEGVGCDEPTVLRVVISRRTQMAAIKQVYDEKYSTEPLRKRIASELSSAGLSELARAVLLSIGEINLDDEKFHFFGSK